MTDRAFALLCLVIGVAVFVLVAWAIQAVGVAAFGPSVPTELVSSCSLP